MEQLARRATTGAARENMRREEFVVMFMEYVGLAQVMAYAIFASVSVLLGRAKDASGAVDSLTANSQLER